MDRSIETDVVVLGSPGIRYDEVRDLPIPAARFWAGLIPGDEIMVEHERGGGEAGNIYRSNFPLPVRSSPSSSKLLRLRSSPS